MRYGRTSLIRSSLVTLAAAALVAGAAGCTSSAGNATTAAPSGPGVGTSGVGTSGATTSSGAPGRTSAPSLAPTTPAWQKPVTYKRVSKDAGKALPGAIGGLPGVASTVFYPDTHTFAVYFRKTATKLDRSNVDSLVKQRLAKQPMKSK